MYLYHPFSESFSKHCENINAAGKEEKKQNEYDGEDDVMSVCPICNKPLVGMAEIERHFEFCKGSNTSSNSGSLKPLPKPVYHLLKDAQIRSKLEDLGLRTTGDRTVTTER